MTAYLKRYNLMSPEGKNLYGVLVSVTKNTDSPEYIKGYLDAVANLQNLWHLDGEWTYVPE